MRPLWSGTIAFGLVSVPVDVYPANRSTGPSLRMLAEDGTPLSRRYHCPADDRDVPREHLVRGYALETGEYVIVEDEELEALEPRKSREIDLRRFVPADELPPLFFERAYYLTPSGDTTKAYRLLADAMERSGRAGIATFVMRGKEYLVAVFAEAGVLRAETLRFHDEVRGPDDVELPDGTGIDDVRVKRLRQAIRAEARPFVPEELRDEDAEALVALAEEKRKSGADVHEVEEAEARPAAESGRAVVLDLLESIRRGMAEGDVGSEGEGTRLAAGGKGSKRDSRRRKRAMPKGWSRKDERKYEHIKESARERGRPEGRAKEIAARTVNKGRREEGRTPNKKTQGTGKPGEALEDRTKDELYNIAADMDIGGRSRMRKDELISAIRENR